MWIYRERFLVPLLLALACGCSDARSGSVGVVDVGGHDVPSDQADDAMQDRGDAEPVDLVSVDSVDDGHTPSDLHDQGSGDSDAAEADTVDARSDNRSDRSVDGEPDDPSTEDSATEPRTPEEIFGSRYWNVYRPNFFAHFYEEGRVCDRIVSGVKMWGDNTAFMGFALSTFVFEYEAAGLEESLAIVHEILDAYHELDVLGGDLLDGYVVRCDRGPDYDTNWFTRNNEPSGDQMLSTMRGLYDVVTSPGALVHDGVDLKELARVRAAWMGNYLREHHFRIYNQFGDLVRRGDDQRWPAWAFQQGAAHITSLPRSLFTSPWDLFSGVPIGAEYHKSVTRQFIVGTFEVTEACVGGRSVNIAGFEVDVDCNEFNIGLGGDAAIISLDTEPTSDDWFSAWVPRDAIISQGNAMLAMYARYKFNDSDEGLYDTAARFLDAPATPPTGESLDPEGWCTMWRWWDDFDFPERCAEDIAFLTTFSGLDYMLPRAFSAANGEFPE